MTDSMAITPPESSPYQIRLDIQAECKRYVDAKEDLESAKVEMEENEANIKTTLEYLRTEYDLEDIEEIERIANDRDFT
jgi:hypothetical protein